MVYASIVFVLFLVTALVPAKYLAKIAYLSGGFFFWHVIPILQVLAKMGRLPPMFSDVPTDADYAMELISQRVAAGLPVQPKPSAKKRRSQHEGADDATQSIASDTKSTGLDAERNVDWTKWARRGAAVGKAFNINSKTVASGSQPKDAWLPRNALIPPAAFALGRPPTHVETHTFPAQHRGSSGLITLTPTTFFFTSLLASDAKFVFHLSELRRVKKTGMFKGLCIQWSEGPDGAKVEREEKFVWISGRDELFARLVGADGRRWIKV